MSSVNHPSHYLKEGHVECIELLKILTDGYTGIAAFDVGQSKYIFRCGTKKDSSLDLKTKTIEDIEKLKWYITDFKSRKMYCIKQYNQSDVDLLVKEFTFDKPSWAKDLVGKVVTAIYMMDNEESTDKAIELINELIALYEKNF